MTLCLVSKDIHRWIVPVLYHTVVLPTPQHLALFEATITRTQLAPYVRNLFLRSMSIPSGELAANILSRCSNVQRLVVDALYRQSSIDITLRWPLPWEVVYIYGATSWLQRGHPSLQNITHIHLDGIIFSSTMDICLALPRLSHLGVTHVNVANDNHVYDENFVRLIRRALSTHFTLQMVLIQLQPISTNQLGRPSGARIWIDLAKIQDDRLLARTALDPDDYFRALEAGTTIWDDAATWFADWRHYPYCADVTTLAAL